MPNKSRWCVIAAENDEQSQVRGAPGTRTLLLLPFVVSAGEGIRVREAQWDFPYI